MFSLDLTKYLKNQCFRNLIYAQGLPLAITILVLIVDKTGRSYIPLKPERVHLPNMGEFSCFIGNGEDGKGKSYFENPIFIYFQSFLLV